MFPFRASWFAALSRVLYTHNPFYLVSVLLVLFGLHRSTAAIVDWKGDALTIGLLFGYTLLLALAAFAVVRFGKVWDDARTIMLVIILLFLAISVRFDVITLNDPRLGGALLFAGFAFAVFISEGLLRSLRIHLAAIYRCPYYLLLALLFSYPVWLASFSVEGHDSRMAWSVFLFPAVASAVLLTLWPAARRKGQSDVPNGTPWPWPLYPWSLFVMLVIGIGLRSYWLSISFQVGKVADLSFQPYFLMPLGLVTAFLALELATTAEWPLIRQIALWAPLGLLLIAFPGDGGNKIAVDFLHDLCQHLGSPAQLTLVGLIAFYGLGWVRGVRVAEWGVMSCLAATAWINAQTISLARVTAPELWPLHCVAVIQLGLALKYNRMSRVLLPIVIELGVAWQREWYDWPIELSLYCIIHGFIVALLLAGALLNDPWARRLRLIGSVGIPLAAIVALLVYDTLFASVPRAVDSGYLSMLAIISLIYWWRTPTVANLVGAFTTTAVLGLLQLRQAVAPATQTTLATGWPWLAWGMVFLLIALAISFLKGGASMSIGRELARFNVRLRNTKPMQ